MEYFQTPLPRYGDGFCSDWECPCNETRIPVGEGYLYISRECCAFRRDCRTADEAYAKTERLARKRVTTIMGPGIAAPILVCEIGARKRRLDLEIAARDAKHWWATEQVPLRPTPQIGEPGDAFTGQAAAARTSDPVVRDVRGAHREFGCMEYFQSPLPRYNEGFCSDGECPCNGTRIPVGEGYLYIPLDCCAFRWDCRTIDEGQTKAKRLSRESGTTIIGPGIAAPILVCEIGARKRRLDLEIAARDAKHWWATTQVPFRPTPQIGEPEVAFTGQAAAARTSDPVAREVRSPPPSGRLSNQTHQQGNALTIEVPNIFGKRTIVFTSDCVTEGEQKIYYRDATKMSYSAVMHSTNFIPDSQTYNFMVGSADQKIRVEMSTTLYIGNATRKDIWQKLVGIAMHLIQPRIVENLLRRIFVDGEAVRINDIEFTREGYSRGKLFGGREQILWADASFVPAFHAGNVYIWGGKGSNPKVHFYKISLDEPNAVVVPELMKACAKAAAIGYIPISDGNRTGWQILDGSPNSLSPRSERT